MNGNAVYGGVPLLLIDVKVPFPRTVAVTWSADRTQASGQTKKVTVTLSLKAFTGWPFSAVPEAHEFVVHWTRDMDLLVVGCFVSLTQLRTVRTFVSLICGA